MTPRISTNIPSWRRVVKCSPAPIITNPYRRCRANAKYGHQPRIYLFVSARVEHGGILYVWDGYAAIHFQIEAGLGLPRLECAEFAFSKYENEILAWYHTNQKQLLVCPAYIRIAEKIGIDITKTSYIDEASSAREYTGYKVMAYDPARKEAISLANKKFTIALKVGKIITTAGKGMYVSNDRQFVMDYYSGLTDESEVLVTFTFTGQDIVAGDPEARQSEITVKKAIIKSFEIL